MLFDVRDHFFHQFRTAGAPAVRRAALEDDLAAELRVIGFGQEIVQPLDVALFR